MNVSFLPELDYGFHFQNVAPQFNSSRGFWKGGGGVVPQGQKDHDHVLQLNLET